MAVDFGAFGIVALLVALANLAVFAGVVVLLFLGIRWLVRSTTAARAPARTPPWPPSASGSPGARSTPRSSRSAGGCSGARPADRPASGTPRDARPRWHVRTIVSGPHGT